MHDLRALRDDPAAFDSALARRGLPPQASALLALDAARRAAILAAETAQAEANRLARDAGEARQAGDEAAFARLRAEAAARKEATAAARAEAERLDAALRDALMLIPNAPLPEVPDGPDETGNVELRRWGSPAVFGFAAREHFDLPCMAGLMDFAAAARLSGSRFVVLKGAAARLHRALAQFMLDLHTGEHGLTEVWTPVLVRPEAMTGTGQLPKFADESYQTTDGRWLVPTAEVTLTNLVAGEMLDADALPLRLAAHTQCFRAEAGSAGKDVAGMLRQHQFEKVEMVTICTPETARAEHDRMTDCAEAVLRRLGLPHRTLVLCTGDMGFGAECTHDIEVWLPGQGRYREISSVSTCGQFQARRMEARFRSPGGRPEFVATLNGSGLAVGRTLIAVLENGQAADGSVTLPAALAPYLGGAARILPDGSLA
jgi:seryl-tRNA synthetase